MSNPTQMANPRPAVSSMNSDRFKCNFPNCGRVCPSKAALIIHRRIHTGERPFRCTDSNCEKSFKSKTERRSHHLCVHVEKKFKCEVCDKSFGYEPVLKAHRQRHSSEPFECSLCGASYKSKTGFNYHRAHHSATQRKASTSRYRARTNEDEEYRVRIAQPNRSDGLASAANKRRSRLSTIPGQTPNSTVHRENAEGEEERGSRRPESSEGGGQLQSSGGASSEPAARDVLDGEEQNDRSDQGVSASRDRVSAAISVIVLSSDEEDDSDDQEEPEMSGQDLNLHFEDEYKHMSQVADDESSELDEARGDEALNEELNGNLFFEEEYRRLVGVN